MKKHEVCPYCGSKNIEEIKPLWGICYDCEGNFHMIPLTKKEEEEAKEVIEGRYSSL